MQQVHGKLFLRFSKLRKWRFKTDGEMSVACIASQKKSFVQFPRHSENSLRQNVALIYRKVKNRTGGKSEL